MFSERDVMVIQEQHQDRLRAAARAEMLNAGQVTPNKSLFRQAIGKLMSQNSDNLQNCEAQTTLINGTA